jgi:hypothetical protein
MCKLKFVCQVVPLCDRQLHQLQNKSLARESENSLLVVGYRFNRLLKLHSILLFMELGTSVPDSNGSSDNTGECAGQ